MSCVAQPSLHLVLLQTPHRQAPIKLQPSQQWTVAMAIKLEIIAGLFKILKVEI